tara:strand:- start:1360 stop:2424 length:1065 start_codon:yes stop_codon:yes gene_type:complete
MSYIGKEPQTGAYNMLDALTASATASYSLTLDSTAFVPESANHLLVSLNGVIQKAGSSYTVSGSTLTFSSSLASSDSIDFVLALGNVLDIGTPSDATVTNAKTNFVSTSSAAGLQIKGDNTTAGTLQLNCEQNSHGIKLRSPAHSTSSSYTLTFPGTDPSADKFLKTDGSGNLSFADASGTWVLLQTTTLSSTTGNVDFNNVFDSTYKNYVVIGSQIRGDANSKIVCRFGTGSTPTFDSSANYKRVVSYISDNGSDSIKHSTSDTGVLVTPNTIKYDTGDASFIMYFPEPQNTNRQLIVHFSGGEKDTNPAVTHFDGAGQCGNISASTPITSVRFTPNAGSGFDTGTFKLYGVK